jgi:hypothetical protein
LASSRRNDGVPSRFLSSRDSFKELVHRLILGKVLSENEASIVVEILCSLGLVSHKGVSGFDCLGLLSTHDGWLGRTALEGFEIRIELEIVGVLVLELLPLRLAEVLVDVVLHVGLSVDP